MMAAMPKMSDEYEIEDCLRTLIHAEEIKKDKEKMKKVKALAKKKMEMMNKFKETA